MFFYISIILLSTLGVYVTRKKNIFLTILIGILPISLLTGLRDTTVGTDLGIYVVRLWESCKFSDFSDVLYYNEMMEIGYVAFCYLISLFTSEIQVFLFIEHFILLTLLIYYIRKTKTPHATLLYFIILVFLYNASLNLMRQFFTLILCVGALNYLTEKKTVRFILFLIIASYFHNSIILLILLVPIFYLLEKFPNKTLQIQFYIFIGGILFSIFFPIILEMLINYGLINSKYVRYLNQDFATHKIDFILSGVIYLVTFIGQSKDSKNRERIRVLAILTIILTMCGTYNDVASRVAMYIYIYAFLIIFTYSQTLHTSKQKLNLFLISSIVTLRFVYISITTDYSETIPYTSKILGIE